LHNVTYLTYLIYSLCYFLFTAALKKHAQENINRGHNFLYNRETANNHIANWLKDAKKRLANEEKKKQQDEHLESDENE